MLDQSDPALPAILDPGEKARLRLAVYHATAAYPGAVGELISRELTTWAEFGYRFDNTGLVRRLVDDVLQPRKPV